LSGDVKKPSPSRAGLCAASTQVASVMTTTPKSGLFEGVCRDSLLVPLAVLVLDLAEERASTSSSYELALGVRHFYPKVSYQLSSTCRLWRRQETRVLPPESRSVFLAAPEAEPGSVAPSRTAKGCSRAAFASFFAFRFIATARRFAIVFPVRSAASFSFSSVRGRSVFHFLRSKGRQGSGRGASFFASSLCRCLLRLCRFPCGSLGTALWRGSRRRSRPRRATPSTPVPPRGQVGECAQLGGARAGPKLAF
jgi:hypothetical protein